MVGLCMLLASLRHGFTHGAALGGVAPRTMRALLAVPVLTLVIVAAVAYAAPPAAAQVIILDKSKAPRASGPVCGGVVNGQPQQPCGSKGATYEGAALGTCPAGSFFDIGKWECWTCPAGYDRSAAAVDTDRACAKPDKNVRGDFGPAQYRGPRCPAGSFFDPIRGGECWSCPAGYRRSAAHIEAGNACFIPAREDFARTIHHGNWTIFSPCPKGQFGDPNGDCYTCPNGFSRTGHPAWDDRACSRAVGEQQSRATVVTRGECQPGEILDAKIQGAQNVDTGGGCWKCPQAWDRTVFPVDGNQACEKGGGFVFRKAEKKAALTCQAGQHFDFIGVSDADLRNLQSRKLAAQGAKATQSGTCWSCPHGFKRSVYDVRTNAACAGTGFEWYTAPYPEPGLFGIGGAEDVVLEILRDRKGVEAAIEAIAKESKQSLDSARKSFWEEIRDEPESSPILVSVAQAALMAAIEAPAKATPAQRALVNNFAKYYRDRQTYLAKDALAAYDAWAAAGQYFRSRDTAKQPSMMTLIDTGSTPPDFYEVVHAGVFVGLGAGAAMGAGYAAAISNPAIHKAIFPFAKKSLDRALEKATLKITEEAIEKFGTEIGKQVAKEGIKAAAKSLQKLASVMKALSSIGPTIIITIATEIVTAEIEKAIAIAEARPKLLTSIAAAQRLPEFWRMIDNDAGYGNITGYWSLATSGKRKPTGKAAQEMAAIAEDALGMKKDKTNTAGTPTMVIQLDGVIIGNVLPLSGPLQWEQIPGRAHDIALATDGTVWVIGDNKVPGGRGIYFRGPKDRDWKSVPGGAVRIAIAGTAPWLVNDGGIAFERAGANWADRPVLAGGKIMKAADVGASAKGVWALAEPTKQGNFAVYRWTGKQWLRDQSAWGTRITVDADGNPWLTNAAGQIFALVNGKWQPFTGSARDIAVDAFGAPVVVDGTGKVQVFDMTSNAWRNTGRDGTAVALGGGKVWHLGPGTEVYRQK